MTNKEKKVLNMFIDNVEESADDATKVSFEAVIFDGTVSRNNVKVTDEAMLSSKLLKSVKNKPIVADISKYGFGDHEVELVEDLYGNKKTVRNTVPIGVFTENGYITTKEIDGVETKVMMGKGVLWKSRFTDAVEYLQNMYNADSFIPMSSEYLYKNPTFDEDGVEIHGIDSDITLEGLCILNSEVTPAYDSSTFTMLNSERINEFSRLVAQAFNQSKEDNDLAEDKKDTPVVEEDEKKVKDLGPVKEEDNKEEPEVEPETKVEDDKVEPEVEPETEPTKKKEEEKEVEPSENEIQLNAKVNELIEQVTQLNAKVGQLTAENTELAGKLDNATGTIVQLNSELEVLKPIHEQMLNAQKEEKIAQAMEKYSKALNAEIFKSEDVQTLILNSVEEGEVAISAKSQLHDLVLEQFNTKEPETKTQVNSSASQISALAGLVAPKRENMIPTGDDPLKALR